MNLFWLLRASKLVRRPPSGKRLMLIAVVITIALALYGIEQIWGWPEWLTPQNTRPGRLVR